MGVLACSRSGCSNIMCDIYIPEIGYICHECKKQFREYMLNKPHKVIFTEENIRESLREFIDNVPIRETLYGAASLIDDFFKKY